MRQWNTELYALVKTCDYKAELQDEMLRDRLVVGIRDKVLLDKLQMEAKLSLESAKKTIRQLEAVRQELQEDSRKGHAALEAVTKRSNHLAIREELPAKTVNHPSKEGDKIKETPAQDVAGESMQLGRNALPQAGSGLQ